MRDRPDFFLGGLSGDPPCSEGDLVLSVRDRMIGVHDGLDLSVSL